MKPYIKQFYLLQEFQYGSNPLINNPTNKKFEKQFSSWPSHERVLIINRSHHSLLRQHSEQYECVDNIFKGDKESDLPFHRFSHFCEKLQSENFVFCSSPNSSSLFTRNIYIDAPVSSGTDIGGKLKDLKVVRNWCSVRRADSSLLQCELNIFDPNSIYLTLTQYI